MAVLTYPANGAAFTAARLAAQNDADDRCRRLLDFRAELAFHGNVLRSLPPGHAGRSWLVDHHVDKLVDEIAGLVTDEVLATATDHNLWDGIDPADCPLNTVKQMVAEHRAEMRRIAA